MADSRFFKKSGEYTLAHIASATEAVPKIWKNNELQNLQHTETEQRIIKDVATLSNATADDVSFLDNPKYRNDLTNSKAAAIFIREKYAKLAPEGTILLISDDPYRAYAIAAQIFYPTFNNEISDNTKSEIHNSAVIDNTAQIAEGCIISAGAVIEADVTIGKNTFIGANSVIQKGVEIGENCRIDSLTAISHAIIGNNVIIHRNASIGQDGFGFAMSAKGHEKVPQLGRVIIEDWVDIGANCCIDRGAGTDTVIRMGTKIDNLVQIGHNVEIGHGAIIVSQVGISGSTKIGDGAILAGQVGVAGHLKIGAGAQIAAKAGIMSDVEAGAKMGGFPAMPIREWHKQTIAISRLAKEMVKKQQN